VSAGFAAAPGLGLTRGRTRAGQSTVLALCSLTALGAALRFWRIGHQGFWFDEGNTVLLIHLSPGKMLGLLPQTESTPPLYYCIAWVWARVFGFGEAGVRSLSALAGTLLVPIAYAAAAELYGQRARGRADVIWARRAGLTAAALCACNPLLIWYSQEARAYSLMVALCGLSLLAWARARAKPTPGRLAAWAIASVLAFATHYYSLVAVVPEALWLLVEHRRRRAVVVSFAVVAAAGAALLPLAISQNSTGNDSWIASAPFGPRLRQIIPQFLIGTGLPDRTQFKYAAFALAIVALGLLAVRAEPFERRRAAIAGALALGGFALALLLVAIGFDDLITRNILALWLPAALAVTGGLACERAGVLGAATAAALCAIGIFATVAIGLDRNLQRPDWRYVARALGPPPAGGRAILIQHYAYLLPLSLYLPHLAQFRAPERVSEIDVISISSPQQPLCWWGAACNLIPSQMQRSYPIAGFHAVARRRVLQFTILTLRSSRPRRLTRARVAAALRTTRLRHDVLIYERGTEPVARRAAGSGAAAVADAGAAAVAGAGAAAPAGAGAAAAASARSAATSASLSLRL